MIQRKQSLWLLFAALCYISLLFLPYGFVQKADINSPIILDHKLTAMIYTPLLMATLLGSALSVITIFLYNNRGLQGKLCWLNMVIAMICLALQIMHASQSALNHKLAIGLVGNSLYIGVVMPVAALLCCFLSYQGIRRDEKLIRSADRLR